MGAGDLSVLPLDCPSLPLRVVSSFWFPRWFSWLTTRTHLASGSLGGSFRSPLLLAVLVPRHPRPSHTRRACPSPCLSLALLVPYTPLRRAAGFAGLGGGQTGHVTGVVGGGRVCMYRVGTPLHAGEDTWRHVMCTRAQVYHA